MVIWEGLEKVATYKNHIGESDRIKEAEKERRSLEEKAFFNNLLQKLKSEGFQKLNSKEVETIGAVIDEVTTKTEDEEKLDLVKVARTIRHILTLLDPILDQVYSRSHSKAMDVNLQIYHKD